jgi:hypothetical protein
MRARRSDQRGVLERGLERAESGLGEPHALLGDLAEVIAAERGLEDDRAGVDFHSAGPVVLEAFLRGNRERLYAVGIARPAGNMDFRRADGGRHPAMHVAFQIADGLLSRREIAERDVHMRIDQSRNGGRTIGVDHEVAGFDVRRRRHADRDNAVAVGDDRIPLDQGIVEIAGDDLADIDDRDAHSSSKSDDGRQRRAASISIIDEGR